VAETVSGLAMPPGADLLEAVIEYVGKNEDQAWTGGLAEIVEDIASEVPR
jgi:hypothetical protein